MKKIVMGVSLLLFISTLSFAALKSTTSGAGVTLKNSHAIEVNEKYQGVPQYLQGQDVPGYIEPFSGFVPKFTKVPSTLEVNFPIQSQNIKVDGKYDGIEVQGDKWMTIACEEALYSAQTGGGPFGAVILQIDAPTGNVIRYWKDHNHVTEWNDPTAHAEVSTIRQACADLGVFDLSSISKSQSKLPQPSNESYCIIYSSAEPCPMCYSAIEWSRMSQLIFGATRYDAAVQGVYFSDENIYLDLSLPYSQRKFIKVYQSTVPNSLDAFNYWKRSDTKHY